MTTIAPTGTISLVAETSSGIEPNFSWAYVRKDTLGTRTYVHTLAAQALGIDVDQTDAGFDRCGRRAMSLSTNSELPPHFISAMTISAEQHVHVLAAAQRNVDNSVSKTCNGAVNDTLESVDHLYRLARQLGCKAVSYYRDGSRENQVLTSMKAEDRRLRSPQSEAVVDDHRRVMRVRLKSTSRRRCRSRREQKRRCANDSSRSRSRGAQAVTRFVSSVRAN